MITVSNGNSKFILGTAAAELSGRSALDAYLTAGYPTHAVLQLVKWSGFGNWPSVKRLLARQENVPDKDIYCSWASEFLSQFANLTRSSPRISGLFHAWSLSAYRSMATKALENNCLGSKIYHFRSGYGGSSIAAARRQDMIIVCDHSIVHPLVMEALIRGGGKLRETPPQEKCDLSLFWEMVLEDIDEADHVIVNSEFVKTTFLSLGYDSDRIHVAYAGIENDFLTETQRYSRGESSERVRLLFAGEFGQRKGANFLVEALKNLDSPWSLEIVGNLESTTQQRHSEFLGSDAVTLTGYLPRLGLAARFSEADIFLFPSLAEGSARVVFMALASGCFVITTKNSGSVVQDGIHGLIVPPGDARALTNAIKHAWSMGFEQRSAIGKNGVEVVQNHFRQAQYGSRLNDLYLKILETAVIHD